MSRFEFIVLSILLDNNAISRIRGMTIKDILDAETLDYSYTSYYALLKDLKCQGLVDMGAKDRKALTFYITQLGIQRLKEEKE